MKRRKTLLLLSFGLLFAALLWREHTLLAELALFRDEIDDLTRQERQLTESLSRSARHVQLYKASLAEIALYQRALPKDNVEFYSLVEGRLARNNAVVNAIRPSRAEGGRVAVQIDFSCPYYALLELLADWRSLEAAVRLRSLVLTLGQDGQVGATAELESVLEEGASK